MKKASESRKATGTPEAVTFNIDHDLRQWLREKRTKRGLEKKVNALLREEMEKDSRIAGCDYSHVPNATTLDAMKAADRGEGKRFKNTAALFKDLGI